MHQQRFSGKVAIGTWAVPLMNHPQSGWRPHRLWLSAACNLAMCSADRLHCQGHAGPAERPPRGCRGRPKGTPRLPRHILSAHMCHISAPCRVGGLRQASSAGTQSVRIALADGAEMGKWKTSVRSSGASQLGLGFDTGFAWSDFHRKGEELAKTRTCSWVRGRRCQLLHC